MSEAAAMLDLAERLSQAEKTIEALLSGQIDAVVDPSSNSPVLLFKAQYELRKSEERFHRERDRAQRYLDSAEVILLALDLDGRISLVNRYASELLGWTRAELMGCNWIDTCVPESHRVANQEIFRSILAGASTSSENPVVTRSGEEKMFEWRSSLLTDEHDNVTGVFSCGTDITAKSRAAEALRLAEERTRFALQTAGVGVWDLDYATGVLKWSEELERQFGFLPGTFHGTEEAFAEGIHPEDLQGVLQIIADAKKEGREFAVHHRMMAADGSVRWISGAGRFELGEGGRLIRGSGISIDVTEQHTLTAQVQQSQKMEAIGQLASGVAHDFNNLLTVILGFADLMTAGISPASEHGNDLAEIIKAAQRASGLTKQLLAFSRQQILNASHVDVNVLISEMSGMLERLIGEQIEIDLKLSSGLPKALIDNGQLEQVVMNLVVNARDAMPGGGRITIATGIVARTAEARRREDSRERYITLYVTDTGEGMTKETERRLFEPFFTTKGAGKGTGLGLSTTYGIIKQSKGFIEVETELGQGTTFKVYLPCAENPPSALIAEDKPDEKAEIASGTILLVEDEAGVRQLAHRILEKAGYRIVEAANGDDATAAYAEHRESIDLVVTDMIMPGCGGPELVRRLRSHNHSLRVLYMSGYSEHSDEEQAARDSGSPYVQKPFTASELLSRVREALARS
ncbi:MAG: PAS domain S-box protein [Gemmatimonadota bacterium]|nr:PAS domain S-box protein [Gemmatimonadota bacterium]